MIIRYRYGTPFFTDAVPLSSDAMFEKKEGIQRGLIDGIGEVHTEEDRIVITVPMTDHTRIYGLGENVRGINKRGWKYVSHCSDEPHHQEEKNSLYGAHNFIAVTGEHTFGLFVDQPGKVVFDLGYTDREQIVIEIPGQDADVYVIRTEEKRYAVKEVVKEFRRLIGKSYLAPRWAFGYGQSRWGYKTADDIREVADGYEKAGIPLDMIYLDIDYMVDYKDFTVDPQKFPAFSAFVEEMKERGIHLIPIIDAGVKEEAGYDVYEEGRENGYFCKDEQGDDFTVAVWPGRCYFPDFLNSNVRKWFGEKYERLLAAGIDGFWNDMNEPAIFYSAKRLEKAYEKVKEYEKMDNIAIYDYFELTGLFSGLSNSEEDYQSFYHKLDDGTCIRHDKVHNLYGYNMTRAAAEEFERAGKKADTLIFSRSSYIGAHRYGGIWQGDNNSWWSHLELNVKMMPSLNMCGFLYTGADLGGFNENTTEDLLLRWMAFGIFTPLMRNHSALGTRNQELYRYGNLDAFRNILKIRYRLIPYLYQTYQRCVEDSEMMFRPLCFDYPEDERTYEIEDELMLGEELLLAPVVKQNAMGRMVYLPEDMRELRFCRDGKIKETDLAKGDHYVTVPLDEVVIYIKKDKELQF